MRVEVCDGAVPTEQVTQVLADNGDVVSSAVLVTHRYEVLTASGGCEYAAQTVGATTSQMRMLAILACAVTLSLRSLISELTTELVVARERSEIRAQRCGGCPRWR